MDSDLDAHELEALIRADVDYQRRQQQTIQPGGPTPYPRASSDLHPYAPMAQTPMTNWNIHEQQKRCSWPDSEARCSKSKIGSLEGSAQPKSQNMVHNEVHHYINSNEFCRKPATESSDRKNSSGRQILRVLYLANIELASAGKFAVKYSGYHDELLGLFNNMPGSGLNRRTMSCSFNVDQYNKVVEILHKANDQLKGVSLKVQELDDIPQRILSAAADLPDDTERYCTLPPKMESQLLPFQRLGVEFCLRHGGRGLIGDEMGLGKTIQALAVAACYKDEWPILVVTTSSLREQWGSEISAWLDVPGSEIIIYSPGSSMPSMAGCTVFVISYEGVVKLSAELHGKFKIIVLDESHNIKNPKTARTKACLKLGQRCSRLILLSGTPATSRPFELLQQIRALLPAARLTQQAFCDRYCTGDFFGKTKGSKNEEELNLLLCSTVMVRRLKKDVMESLKPKHRQQIYLSLSSEGCGRLRDIKKRLDSVESFEELADEDVWEPSGPIRKNMILNEFYHESAKEKIKPVQDYLVTMLQEDQKMLVFAHHKEMMDGIELIMNQNDVKYIRIDGSTPTARRNEYKKQFQDVPDVRVAVLAIKAAGTGLNFTAANVVVFAELSWVPGDIKQCEDRVHRIGQNRNVSVSFLLGRETIDEIIWRTLQHKLDYVGQILDGSQDTLVVKKKYSAATHGQKNLHSFLTKTEKVLGFGEKRTSELQSCTLSKKGKFL